MMRLRASILSLLWIGLAGGVCAAQSEWTVLRRDRNLVVDGYLDDWEGIPAVTLKPSGTAVAVNGQFDDDDLEITLQAVWDDEALYVAVRWRDNRWDVREVRRRDAVYVTPDRRRRNRMYFFDNLRFQIRELEYDYLLWVAPRIGDRGPFHWQRRLEGMSKREAASPAPVITPRQDNGVATLELIFKWKQLDIEPKKRKKKGLPVEILVADSDLPGSILEAKLPHLKWIEWQSRMRLAE